MNPMFFNPQFVFLKMLDDVEYSGGNFLPFPSILNVGDVVNVTLNVFPILTRIF